MSKSPRRAHAALIGLAVAGALLLVFGGVTLWGYQRQHANESDTASQYQAQSARGEIQAACVQEPRSRTYRCAADVPVADQHDPYAEHDLRAQQDMARWAYAVALVSFGTLLLTGTGVVLLWWTLEATREAVAEAGKATSAAREANNVFRDVSQRELRAYIGIDALGVVDYEPGKVPRYSYRIKNYGATPANKVESVLFMAQTYDHPDKAKVRADNPVTFNASSLPINPGQEVPIEWTTDAVTLEIWNRVKRREETTLVCVYIRYKDIFGRQRRTIVRFYVDPSALKKGSGGLLACNKGNRIS